MGLPAPQFAPIPTPAPQAPEDLVAGRFFDFVQLLADLAHLRARIQSEMEALVQRFMREIPKCRLALIPARKDPDPMGSLRGEIRGLYWYRFCRPPLIPRHPDGTPKKRWKRYVKGRLTPGLLGALGLLHLAPQLHAFDDARLALNAQLHALARAMRSLTARLTRPVPLGKLGLKSPQRPGPLLPADLVNRLGTPELRLLDLAWERTRELAVLEAGLEELVLLTRQAPPWDGYRVVRTEAGQGYRTYLWESPGGLLRERRRGSPGKRGRAPQAMSYRSLRRLFVPVPGIQAILAIEARRRRLAKPYRAVAEVFLGARRGQVNSLQARRVGYPLGGVLTDNVACIGEPRIAKPGLQGPDPG